MINNTVTPAEFLTSGGIGDATYILQDFHKQALNESNKAREIENEVIMQLTGLRSDLQQKIKEIKSLSGDFKNSVDKEAEGSRKAVRHLQEASGLVDTDPAATAGKSDPFIVKLGVDRQIERQIEEENYLHRVSPSFTYLFALLTMLGISQPGVFGSRARVYNCWPNPESIYCIRRHP